MARYKLKEAAVVGDRYYGAGEEVEYDGVPGPHMEPLDPDAKKAASAKREEPARDPGMIAHPEERIIPGRAQEAKEALEKKVEEERSERGGGRRG
jgi:hypothetical protein